MNLSRRSFTLGAAAGALVAVPGANAAFADSSTGAAASSSAATTARETAQLKQLYAAAQAEGGKVTVYMGGDKPGQWDYIGEDFTAAYPNMAAHVITDLSKVHDARIDNQLANGDLVADVAILQTADDFERWKKQGSLLKYKPVGWDKVFSNAKDPDGYWTAVFYGAFAYMVNTKLLPADPSSFVATDLLKPEFKNKLIFTYPNDDDAVLFFFKGIVDKYGWKWLAQLVAQNPAFVRGTPYSAGPVAAGTYLATAGTTGDPSPDATVVLPSKDPFNSWAQHGAILAGAKHKAGAKLFTSWLNSRATQENVIATWTWSVRSDVAPPTGLKPLSSYKTTDALAFPDFMRDRAAVERFRSQVQLYVGQVTGADPADPDDSFGLTPGSF
jgi:ABC-type Fe3+ transport system substrate-binding protein